MGDRNYSLLTRNEHALTSAGLAAHARGARTWGGDAVGTWRLSVAANLNCRPASFNQFLVARRYRRFRTQWCGSRLTLRDRHWSHYDLPAKSASRAHVEARMRPAFEGEGDLPRLARKPVACSTTRRATLTPWPWWTPRRLGCPPLHSIRILRQAFVDEPRWRECFDIDVPGWCRAFYLVANLPKAVKQNMETHLQQAAG